MIHVVSNPLIPGFWREAWRPGNGVVPDVWTATKKLLSGIIVQEVEPSNASFVRGQTGSRTFSAAFEIKAPSGYVLVEDCDRDAPDSWDTMHATMRRVACYPESKPGLRAEAIRAAQMTYDAKWRDGRLAYGPCNVPMPNLPSQKAAAEAYKVAGWLNHLRQILQSKTGLTGPVEDSEDGIFIRRNGWTPWGISDRGAPAGSGIFFYTGWEQAPDLPAYLWLVACCNHERAWHAYDRNTGKVITADDYPDPGPKYQAGTSDVNNGWLPEFVGIAPTHEPGPLPYDAAHSIRGFRHLVALSEMVDSPAVKRMLRSVAAQFRLQFSERGPHPTANYTPPALRTWLGWVRSAPHKGFFGMDTGRQTGWPALVIAQSVKMGATENKPWASMFAEFAETGAMPTGILSRCADGNPGSVWFDPVHDTAHSFEVPIFWHGAIGCSMQSGRRIKNPIRYATALYEEAPMLPYYSGHGPPQYAYVAQRGGQPYQSIPGGKGNTGDSSHSLAGCALAAHVDPAQRSRWVANGHKVTSFADYRESAGIIAQEQRA